MTDVGIAGLIVVIISIILWMIIHYFRWYHGEPDAVKAYFKSIRRTLLAPLYYFFGFNCRICGKEYLFRRHSAFMCCPGPHNAKWRHDHPNEKCLTDPNTLTPRQRLKSLYGDDYWQHINTDAYLRTCTWCGGTGRKYGVPCDVCGGSGKLIR